MVSGYAQKFKMAEASDNSCSSEEAALEETVETSVMLRYNDNKRT